MLTKLYDHENSIYGRKNRLFDPRLLKRGEGGGGADSASRANQQSWRETMTN